MKLVVVAAFAAALVALGGVGWACGGGGGGCNGGFDGKCSESPEIAWVSPASTTASARTVVCAVTATSSALTASAKALYPGTHCWLNATLEDMGSGAVDLVPHIAATLPAGCTLFVYSDNLLSAAPEVELAPGHSYAYRASYGLGATAGNACEKASATFVVTITASGTSSCQGFAYDPNQDGNCCG